MQLCLNALVQLLDEYASKYFSWNSIFDEKYENIFINLDDYLKGTDVFDCILNILKNESIEKTFKWQFSEATKIIRGSKHKDSFF